MKRFYAILLTLALLLSCAPFAAAADAPAVEDVPVAEAAPVETAPAAAPIETAAAEPATPAQTEKAELQDLYSGTCGDNLNWYYENHTLTVTGTGEMYDMADHGRPWEYVLDLGAIHTLVLEHGVTSVGIEAFFYCNNLTTVVFSDTLTKIGQAAFSGCDDITALNFPDSLTTIDDSAFTFCNGLTNLVLPDGVTEISQEAFANCQNLVSITLGNYVTTIGNGAFGECYALPSIKIPDSVVSIEQGAFGNCTSLANVDLGEGVQTIGNSAFANTPALTELFIPASVTEIDTFAFDHCPAYFTVSPANEVYSACEGVLFEGRRYEHLMRCRYTLTGEYTTPPTTEIVLKYAFNACTGITKVVLGTHVERVNVGAFGGCSSLETVVLPAALTKVERTAFQNCDNVTTVIYCGTPVLWRQIDFGGKKDYNDVVKYATPQYHSWVSGVVTQEPTCEEDGIQAAVCKYCGASSDAAPIPALGHKWNEGVRTAEATCTTPGEVLYTCENDANHTYIDYTPAALGHDLVSHEGKSASCTEAGWRPYQTCTRCDYTTKVEIPPYGHNWDRGVVTTQPTETTAGVKTYTCMTCQATREEVIPAQHTHNFSEEVTKSPSCTETGLRTYTCTCGYSYTEVIPADGHNLITVAEVPATYETEGVKAHKECTVCHKLFLYGEDGGLKEVQPEELVIPKLHEHNYNETVTKPASCKEPGLKTFTCTICGASYTEVIPQTAHSLKHVEAKAATTTEPGNIEYWQCEICGAIFTDAAGTKETSYEAVLIPKLHSHSYTSKITKLPSCDEEGEKTYTCACGDSYTEPIPALGHKLLNVPGKAATTEEEGNIEHWKCEKCMKLFADGEGKTELAKDAVIIPKLPDADAPTITVASVTGRAGETVDVTLDLSNNKGIAGAVLTLSYDPALTVVGCAAGTALDGLTFTEPGKLTANPIRFLWDGLLSDDSNGTILTVSFAISSDAPEGDCEIALTYEPGDIYDNDLNDLNVAVVNGKVTVQNVLPGDVNGDNTLNAKDVTALRRHLAGGYTIQVVESQLDINKDGALNAKDVTFLRRALAGGYGIQLG